MFVNAQDQNITYFNEIAKRRIGKKRRHEFYWKEISRYCNYFSQDSLSVLEVGCGAGELLQDIKGFRKVGIDFSEEMVQIGKKLHPEIEFHVMHAEEIQLSEKFDLIILSNLIGYSKDVQIVFEQLHSVCHAKTKIIVTYYNYLWEPILKLGEWLGVKTKTPTQNWLTHQDINNLLSIAGFDVYRTAKRTLLPINIPIISSFLNRYLVHFPLLRSFAINFFSFAKPLIITKPEEYNHKYSVSVIIPARNESGNIENAIKGLPPLGKKLEIIFIEGHSKDDTWNKIVEMQIKYATTHTIKISQQKGIGKADAVRHGFSLASNDILMILDADLTVPPEDLIKFYNAIASYKGDFINGCRLVYPMENEAMRFLNLLGNKFFSWAFTWLLEQRFKDTLCGTKVIFREDYLKLVENQSYFGDFDPFGDFDLIFGAHKLNLKIVEIPIRYRERAYGSTNISRIRHGFILLKMCFLAARKIKFI